MTADHWQVFTDGGTFKFSGTEKEAKDYVTNSEQRFILYLKAPDGNEYAEVYGLAGWELINDNNAELG